MKTQENPISIRPKNIPSRRSIRIDEYDYSTPGMYFVTICVDEKKCLFGSIKNGEMQINDIGKMVERCWYDIPLYFPHVETNLFVIMPNHVRGIIHIVELTKKPEIADRLLCPPRSLGAVIRGFKTGVTKWVKKNTGIGNVWQRNYYEHVIRDMRDYDRIAEYIMNNPAGWEKDAMNPNYAASKDSWFF